MVDLNNFACLSFLSFFHSLFVCFIFVFCLSTTASNLISPRTFFIIIGRCMYCLRNTFRGPLAFGHLNSVRCRSSLSVWRVYSSKQKNQYVAAINSPGPYCSALFGKIGRVLYLCSWRTQPAPEKHLSILHAVIERCCIEQTTREEGRRRHVRIFTSAVVRCVKVYFIFAFLIISVRCYPSFPVLCSSTTSSGSLAHGAREGTLDVSWTVRCGHDVFSFFTAVL